MSAHHHALVDFIIENSHERGWREKACAQFGVTYSYLSILWRSDVFREAFNKRLTEWRTGMTRELQAKQFALAQAAYDRLAKLSRNTTVQKWVGPIHVTRAITIRRAPGDVYAFFRNLENLPRFMQHLESVRYVNGFSVWRAKGPAGITIEWQAEIVQDRPGEELSWRSTPGTLVPNAGTVRFKAAPRDRGTELVVELKYDPPAGALGAAMAKLFGEEPSWQIGSDLRRLKQVLETGEVVQSDASRGRGRTPARPSAETETERKEIES